MAKTLCGKASRVLRGSRANAQKSSKPDLFFNLSNSLNTARLGAQGRRFHTSSVAELRCISNDWYFISDRPVFCVDGAARPGPPF